MNQASLLNAARNGDPQAIVILINQSLQPKGISINVVRNGECLTIKAKAQTAPEKNFLVNFLRSGLTKLKPKNVSKVVIQGYAINQVDAAWLSSFKMDSADGQKGVTNIGNSSTNRSSISPQTPTTSTFTISSSQAKLDFLTPLFSSKKNRNGERFVIALGTFIITSSFWLIVGVISKKAPEVTTQTSSTNPSTNLSAPPTNTTIASEVFNPKILPILGTTYQQLEDESTILQIMTSGKTTDGRTEIPQTSLAGVTPNPIAVKKGYPPKGTDVCKLPYSALIRQMYEQCFTDGMNFTQVSNIVGWQGEEVASSGSGRTYRWGDGDGGSMMFVFDNDRLVSKSQVGLKP